jgi:hypothetical protein
MGSIGEEHERRIAIMASAQVSWKDQTGTPHQETARIEDTSRSGACIRMKVPIDVGSELQIKWHKEHFSGTTRYCRQDGLEYILGIQRSTSLSIVPPAARKEIVPNESKLPSPGAAQDSELQRETLPRESIAAIPNPGPTPEASASADLSRTDSRLTARVTAPKVQSHVRRSKKQDRVLQIDVQTKMSSKLQERTAMLEKWINRAAGRRLPDTADGSSNGQYTPKENMHIDASPVKHPGANASANSNGKGTAGFQGDLLSLEDIYRAAGIMNLRLGYSINTVIEMLSSDHIRGLPNDVKRAAVLMALETAGMPIDDVMEDAAQRNEAINAYEAAQQKHVEEYELRKIEENDQIQAEIERITAQLADRMKQNLDEVVAVKDTFRQWQTLKQKEAQRISEAAGMCEKQPPVPAPPVERVESVVALQAAGFVTKP